MKRFFVVALCAAYVVDLSIVSAKDLGVTYGEPTPMLAMYATQTAFAAEKCVSAGYVGDERRAASLLKQFNNLISLRKYRSGDAEFAEWLDSLYGNYESAWNVATIPVRRNFCDGFNAEIQLKHDHWLRWIQPVEYFRRKFSPLTDAAINRRNLIVKVASVTGAAVTTAAAVSAAHDAVSSARAGNFRMSAEQMKASRAATQLGIGLTGAAEQGGRSEGRGGFVISVMDEQTPKGSVRTRVCPVVEHFEQVYSKVDSSVWMTYQPVSVDCRDPIPADSEKMANKRITGLGSLNSVE